MRLRAIRLLRAPGLGDGLAPLRDLDPGLNVVLGPNASGKSTLSRAIRGTLFARLAPDGVLATSTWEAPGGETLEAELAHGAATWRPQAPALPSATAADRYALDLHALQRARQADEDYAAQLAVELSGGYDVAAALKAFTHTGVVPSRLAAECKQASDALFAETNVAEDLVAQEARLPELERQLADARGAQALLPDAERAVELAGKRAELADLEARLAQFPEGLATWTGDEDERAHALDERRQRAAETLREVQAQIERHEAQLARLAFPGAEPSAAEVAAQRARVRTLDQHEHDLGEARGDLSESRAREADARRVLLSDATDRTEIAEETLRELEARLEKRAHAQRVCEAEREVERAFRARLGDGEDDPAGLRRAVDGLRRWLRAAPVGAMRPLPLRAGLVLLVLGLVLLVLGLLLPLVLLGAAGGVALGVGVALLGPRLGSAATPGGEVDAGALQREVERAGLAPSAWNAEAVESRLAALEDRLARANERERVIERLREAKERLATLTAELAARERELVDGIEALGLASGLSSLGVVQQASALRTWLEARSACARAMGREAQVERAQAEALTALGAWLVPLGEAAPVDAAAAAAAVERVDDRRGGLETQRTVLEAKVADRTRAQAEVDAVEAEVAALWARVGAAAGDEHALGERLALHRAWRALTTERDALRRDVGALAVRLAEAEGLRAWCDRDPAALGAADATALQEAVADAAGRLEELAAGIRSIRDALDRAHGGASMEDAITRLEEAETALDEERERAALDVLARLVLEDARAAHESANAPPMLARAQAWFARFTHHAFSLGVDTEGTSRFVAVDERVQMKRGLHELSDGTRVQLLLAVRLAAVEAAEAASGPLPLCLDEVLATSDRTRFREVAAALLALAREGRQILYFTADPAESAAWETACRDLGHEPPRVFDLGDVRGDAAGWGEVDVPLLPTLPEIPAPEGGSAEAYAQRIGVPAPDGQRPVGDWHLVHLLPDHLDALHALLRARLERVGPWRAACRDGAVALLVEEDVVRLAAARAALLEAALDLWRVGRGRRVTWADVEASGAVTATFTERVQEILVRQADDPRAFLDEVRGLKSFRHKAALQLEDHLEAQGIVDPREPLEPGEIAQRALARAASDVAAADLAPDAATAYVLGLLALLT